MDGRCINIYHTIFLAPLPRVCRYLIRLIKRRNIKNYPDNQVIVMRCSVPMFADLMVRTEILQSRAARLLVRSSSIQFEVAATRGGKCRLMEAGCKNPEAETMSMSSRQKTHKVGIGEDSVGLFSKASNRMVMIFTLSGSSWLPERVKGEDVVMAREDYPPGAHACSRPFQTLSFFYCFTRFCLCAQ